MKRFIQLVAIAFILVLLSCASTPKGRAVQYVVATDAGADAFAEGWGDFVDGEIARCRETDADTSEERRACLGPAGKGKELEALLESLVTSQLAVKLAVECDDNPLDVPAEFKANCVDGNPDWAALGAKVLEVWKTIQPFYNAMKGKK